jgi:hypothetical protein
MECTLKDINCEITRCFGSHFVERYRELHMSPVNVFLINDEETNIYRRIVRWEVHRFFTETFCLHLQGYKLTKKITNKKQQQSPLSLLAAWFSTLKKETMSCSETVINFYETTRRLNTDFVHHSEDLKTQQCFAIFISEINWEFTDFHTECKYVFVEKCVFNTLCNT